jgi:hypothetical protein
VTIWGVGALFALIFALVNAFLTLRTSGASIPVRLALFAGGAAAGWLLIWLLFRHENHPILTWLLAGLGLSLLVFTGWFFSAMAFFGLITGSMIAWFPHCWPVVGTSPPRGTAWPRPPQELP